MKALDLLILKNQWSGILRSLGLPARIFNRKNQPCPMCAGRDRFQYSDKGFGIYNCRKCGGGNGYQLLRKFNGWGHPRTLEEIGKIIGGIKPVEGKELKFNPQLAIAEILAMSRPATWGDKAGQYLKSRGLPSIPDGIFYAPRAYESGTGKRMPCMIAKVLSFDGKLVSVHRTFLSSDGGKAQIKSPKKLMPTLLSLAGAAIRLGGSAPKIAIAEGIETAIAVSSWLKIPCWATVSAWGMESFKPPAGIVEVAICGDNDISYTGQAAAYACAKKLTLAGIKCQVLLPAEFGTDWLDYYNKI